MKKQLIIFILLSLFSIEKSYAGLYNTYMDIEQGFSEINPYFELKLLILAQPLNFRLQFQRIKTKLQLIKTKDLLLFIKTNKNKELEILNNFAEKISSYLSEYEAYGLDSQYKSCYESIKAILASVKMRMFLLEYSDVENITSPEINSPEKFDIFLKKALFLQDFLHKYNDQGIPIVYFYNCEEFTSCFSDDELYNFHKITSQALGIVDIPHSSSIYQIKRDYSLTVEVHNFILKYNNLESINNYTKFKEFRDKVCYFFTCYKECYLQNETFNYQWTKIQNIIENLCNKAYIQYNYKYQYPPIIFSIYPPIILSYNKRINFIFQFSLYPPGKFIYQLECRSENRIIANFLEQFASMKDIENDFEHFHDLVKFFDKISNPNGSLRRANSSLPLNQKLINLSEVSKYKISNRIKKLIEEFNKSPNKFPGCFNKSIQLKHICQERFSFDPL